MMGNVMCSPSFRATFLLAHNHCKATTHHVCYTPQACDNAAMIPRRFMELWTLKEAYVKALGRGISAPPGLKGFSVHVDALHTDKQDALGCIGQHHSAAMHHNNTVTSPAPTTALTCCVLPILPLDDVPLAVQHPHNQPPTTMHVLACSEGAVGPLGMGRLMPRLRLEQHVEDVAPVSKVHLVLMEPDAQHVGALCCVDAPDAPLRRVHMVHVAPPP